MIAPTERGVLAVMSRFTSKRFRGSEDMIAARAAVAELIDKAEVYEIVQGMAIWDQVARAAITPRLGLPFTATVGDIKDAARDQFRAALARAGGES